MFTSYMAQKHCPSCKRKISADSQYCPFCSAQSQPAGGFKGTGVDWKSSITIYGYPLIHIALGKDENGKMRIARGFIAIGQFAIGVITIAQFGVGILFGLGQFMIGCIAIGQIAIGALFGLGQLATGYIAIGQLAVGYYGLAQMGFAKYLWTPRHHDPQAVEFFRQFWGNVKKYIPGI